MPRKQNERKDQVEGQQTEDQSTADARSVDDEAIKERPQIDGRSWAVEGNDTSAYVGVDPEYRNYANDTERPYLTDDERKQMAAVGHKTDIERESGHLQTVDDVEESGPQAGEISKKAGDDKSKDEPTLRPNF